MELLVDSSRAPGRVAPFPSILWHGFWQLNSECVCCLWCSLEREPKLCVQSLAQGSQEAKDVGCVIILGDPGSRTAIP